MIVDPRPQTTPVRLGDIPVLSPAEGSASWPDTRVSGVCLDSRRVQTGDLYAALSGANVHGATFTHQAAASGAVAILTDREGWATAMECGLPVIVHANPRSVLGEVSAWIYGTHDLDLTIVGLTGTNGKTTVSYLLENALADMGEKCGLIGTTGIHIGSERLPSARTTPESPDVHALLAVMAERGVRAVLMEVSSHALALGRVDGVAFTMSVFTNLSQDHLDFHSDMEDYFRVKSMLFDRARSLSGVICAEQDWGRRLADSVQIPVVTYSAGTEPADWRLGDVRESTNGSWTAAATGPSGVRVELSSQLPGQFNQANALGALAVLVGLGRGAGESVLGISKCLGVPGRMQPVGRAEYSIFVDYAHTPDAVERVIAAARQFCDGRVIVLLGCGGDRDPDKRPIMGRVAAQGADELFITDDNPRSEDPALIREAMMTGVREVSGGAVVHLISDRRVAIKEVLAAASSGDCVLILGKGHERGQEINSEIQPFDDRDEIEGVLAMDGTKSR